MSFTSSRRFQALGAWFLALSQLFVSAGCRQATGGNGAAGAASTGEVRAIGVCFMFVLQAARAMTDRKVGTNRAVAMTRNLVRVRRAF